MMPNICSRSRKYTLSAEKINAMPSAKQYSSAIITGKNTICQLIPIPLMMSAANTMSMLNTIFINAALATAMGSTNRGKYIFFDQISPGQYGGSASLYSRGKKNPRYQCYKQINIKLVDIDTHNGRKYDCVHH